MRRRAIMASIWPAPILSATVRATCSAAPGRVCAPYWSKLDTARSFRIAARTTAPATSVRPSSGFSRTRGVNELLARRLGDASVAVIRVKAIPKSAKTEIVGEMADGALKIKLAAVPERGRANAELCAYLAREIGVPRANVEVISGLTSPIKAVRIVR